MRICVDVSAAYLSSGRSGIPRIVRKFVETLAARDDVELMCFASSGGDFFEVAATSVLTDSALARGKSAARNVLMLPLLRSPLTRGAARAAWRVLSAGATFARAERLALFGPNDAILLPERAQSGAACQHFKERKGGATLISIAHDLFAITYARDPSDAETMAAHYRTEFDLADGIICGSRTAADNVRRFLGDRSKPILFNYWGADFAGQTPQPDGGRKDGRPVVLSVGAIEPRKNYPFALDICSRLWARGADFTYRIAGAKGWQTIDFLSELKRHPEFERRLLFHDAPDDAQLMSLYRGSDILLSTSLDEGFGLPLMEASALGLGVVCSDIPVYREICGGTARFVPLDDPARAAEVLSDAIGASGAPSRNTPPGLRSWEASMAALCAQIEEIRRLKASRRP